MKNCGNFSMRRRSYARTPTLFAGSTSMCLAFCPHIAEQDDFHADQGPDRRQRLIDELLNRPEHARYWALKWADLLRLQKAEVSEARRT